MQFILFWVQPIPVSADLADVSFLIKTISAVSYFFSFNAAHVGDNSEQLLPFPSQEMSKYFSGW